MKVKWTEVIPTEFNSAFADIPEEIRPKTIDVEYEGEVIDKYHTFWGTPKFVVALFDGSITSVSMLKCTIVK